MIKKPRRISQNELLQVFSDLKNHTDVGMCFLLGAGASVSSGIPSGTELATKWYGELKKILSETDLHEWQKTVECFDENRLATFYTQIFEKRFANHPATGFYYLQDIMKKAEPSIGYSILAQILTDEKTRHKFVITTNFDHMVEDAILLYTYERPLVCGHESLAEYIEAGSIRPTIIKIHRDLLLHPFNKADNTSELNDAWKKTLAPILQNYHLVVIGHSGNDRSLMDYLKTIQFRKCIYWCYREEDEINAKILCTLINDDDCLVKITGFDHFMYELNKVFSYEPLNSNKDLSESIIVKIALGKAKRYEEKFIQFIENNKENIIVEDLSKTFGLDESKDIDWLKIQCKINDEPDNNIKQQLYEKGLKLLPSNTMLISNFACFLYEIKNDYETAENYYQEALKLNKNDAYINGNYALLLHTIRKYDLAEKYYIKSLELDPNNANINGGYAIFLNEVHKDYESAELYYIKALELDPNNANINGNYAFFLNSIRKNYTLAEHYYLKALELDSSNFNINSNYAGFLLAVGKKEQAAVYLEKCLQTNMDHLLLDYWFYRLAHFPEYREKAKQQIADLLKQGVSSIGWGSNGNIQQSMRLTGLDFSGNIQRAEQDGYEDMKELREIAFKISGIEY